MNVEIIQWDLRLLGFNTLRNIEKFIDLALALFFKRQQHRKVG
jgi:hypothetical protein